MESYLKRVPLLIATAVGKAIAPAVGITFAVLWVFFESGRQHGGNFWAALVVLALSIGLARIKPAVSLVLIGAVLLAQIPGIVEPPESTTWPMYLATVIATMFVTLYGSDRIRWLALPVSAAIGLLEAFLMAVPRPWSVDIWSAWTGSGTHSLDPGVIIAAFSALTVAAIALHAVAWAVGFSLRSGVRELESKLLISEVTTELIEAESELLSIKERNRIAQEVHDVVAHSLTVVIAQADGSRFIRASRPEATDAALQAIADAARAALLDVRLLIEGLHDEPGDRPQPSLAELPSLTERMASAGMAVSVQSFGEEGVLTASQQLAVFRIVQESLTNALKHGGPGSAARIVFDWRGPGLALTIASTKGRVEEVRRAASSGHGIPGMQDRARLAGGWLSAGPTDDEFLVTAAIPTQPVLALTGSGAA